MWVIWKLPAFVGSSNHRYYKGGVFNPFSPQGEGLGNGGSTSPHRLQSRKRHLFQTAIFRELSDWDTEAGSNWVIYWENLILGPFLSKSLPPGVQEKLWGQICQKATIPYFHIDICGAIFTHFIRILETCRKYAFLGGYAKISTILHRGERSLGAPNWLIYLFHI